MLFAGAACAQSSSLANSEQLTGVNARLVHTLDAKSARQGQPVEAKLDGSVKTDQGVKLDKGTDLKGTVTNVEKSSNGGPSSITLDFNQAQLKDGKTIPVKVTVVAAYPPSAGTQAMYGVNEVGSAPRHINPQDKFDQQPGQLRHIALHSQVQGNNSGTFEEKDGNVKLAAGTYLQVGIAAVNNTSGA